MGEYGNWNGGQDNGNYGGGAGGYGQSDDVADEVDFFGEDDVTTPDVDVQDGVETPGEDSVAPDGRGDDGQEAGVPESSDDPGADSGTPVNDDPDGLEHGYSIDDATFTWDDMVAFGKFSETYEMMSADERMVLLSIVGMSRSNVSSLIVAKRLLEEGAKSTKVISLVRDLAEKGSDLSLREIIDTSVTVDAMDIEEMKDLVKIANIVLGGPDIGWRKNLPTETLVEKLVEKTRTGESNNMLDTVTGVLDVWPGRREWLGHP